MNRQKIFATVLPYFLALATTACSFLVTYGLYGVIGKVSALAFFLPAVLVSTWFGGVQSGLMATIFSSIVIYYSFTPPFNSMMDKHVGDIVELLLFILEGTVMSYIIDHGYRQEKMLTFKRKEQENKKYIEELENNLAKAKEAIASRDEFLSIASHELKTPLTTVLLQIQTTLHNIRNVSLAEFSVEHLLHMLQSTQTQTKRLSRMINDLLNISLITTHRLELEKEEVDLATLVGDIVAEFMPKFENEGSFLSLSVKESIIGFWDKLRIEQAIDNLLTNALKYGNKKPVEVSVKKEQGKAILEVQDHGIGISENDREKIFLLFRRGTTEQEYQGLGVGLYISQQIIEQHGGKIDVKSRQGSGTIFTMTLPLKTE